MTSVRLEPIKFSPDFKERVWGGRNLARYGFDLPEGRIGEAWAIADHPNGASRVADGPLAGLTLADLRGRFGPELFGTAYRSRPDGRFPLLIKWLDCEDDLSVQVHPDDRYERLTPGEWGKTEMWYVLDAKPCARIVYGLKPGVGRAELERLVAENRVEEALLSTTVKPGDTFYIPAGTVHALCAGVLVAEIQQNSDTTYRLYDYGRLGLDGKPRELHVEDSLNVIRYGESGVYRPAAEASPARPNEWLNLATSPYFVTDKAVVDGEWTSATSPHSFAILMIGEGEGVLRWDGGERRVRPGECYLLPASLGEYALAGRLTVLRSGLPPA